MQRILLFVLVLLQAAACFLIITKVPYTEIDWKAYMEQVEGFLAGQRDYFKLQGNTGPLVYPAGFLYVFASLYDLTDKGRDILAGQFIFALFLCLTVFLVSQIYSKSKRVPLYIVGLFLLSKRVHSIFLLRLFNDPVAMMFMYASIYAILSKRWLLASISFSLALSIKMNVLLFAPGFALIFYQGVGIYKSALYAILVMSLQIGLAYPFLVSNPTHYLSRAFEFSREFLFKWTVNWKFLSPDVFASKGFSFLLLCLHVSLLFFFIVGHWSRAEGGLLKLLYRGLSLKSAWKKGLDPDHVLLVLFTSNFVGIVCARSLHYQFYSWYFHSIPYLLWRTRYHVLVKLVLFFGIEICWNIYPSTANTSLLLLFLHGLLLLGLLIGDEKREGSTKKTKIN